MSKIDTIDDDDDFGDFAAPLGKNQYLINRVQLRGNWKDFNFQLHLRFSKFEVPVAVNLKHIFELFGLYNTCFLI